MEAAALAHAEHHGPPPANRSSRVDPQVLGMLLFIISEVMVFGAFFTAYFFIRVVQGDHWFPVDGKDLPKVIAGFNTVILVSSSFTMHWALEAVSLWTTCSTGLFAARRTRSIRSDRSQPDFVSGKVEMTMSSTRKY